MAEAAAVLNKITDKPVELYLSLQGEESLSEDRKQTPWIQASPYPEPDHLLDLSTLDTQYALIARALTIMEHTTPDYSTAAYKDAFDWSRVIHRLQELVAVDRILFPRTACYIIVFRSRIKPDAVRNRLGELDKEAHREAVESGGLLKYWFGVPNDDGKNLATCLWRKREDAVKGGAGPGHAAAMREVRGLYLEWIVEILELVVEEGATEWDIRRWEP